MDVQPTSFEARFEAILPTLATKADIEALRAEMTRTAHELASSTQKWMLGTSIGLFVGFGGLFTAMSTALKPTPQPVMAPQCVPAPAQPPVVIYVPASPAPAPAPVAPPR